MCLRVFCVSECTCGCVCTHMSSMYPSVRFYFWQSVGELVDDIRRVRNGSIIDLWCWKRSSGCPNSQTWQMFAKDVFNRAQRDFFFFFGEFSLCAAKTMTLVTPCACVHISILRVKKRALIFKGFYSPIAGQDLVPYGGFMQIWDRCLIAWTMESWLKQFLNVLSVETHAWPMSVGIIYEKRCIFLETIGANNHAHRHTELLRLLYLFKIQTPCTLTTQISWRDPLEVHFKCQQEMI